MSELRMAADLGAGNVKVAYRWVDNEYPTNESLKFQKIQSAVYFGEMGQFVVGTNKLSADTVFYEDGTNEELKGKYFICGDAISARGFSARTCVEEPRLKTVNALPLLLSTLVVKRKTVTGEVERILSPGDTNIVLVLSHHSPVAMGPKLIEAIQGVHKVQCDGETFTIQIKLPEESVFQEGIAISGNSDEFCTLDIGQLTCLLTKHKDGSVIQTETNSLGVGTLIRMLIQDPDLQRILEGNPPDTLLINKALVEASLRYENENKVKVVYRVSGSAYDITQVYRKVCLSWFGDAIHGAKSFLGANSGLEYEVIAIGGGCKLPAVGKNFAKAGIHMYSGDPVFANVETMYSRYLEGIEDIKFGSPSRALGGYKANSTREKRVSTRSVPKENPNSSEGVNSEWHPPLVTQEVDNA